MVLPRTIEASGKYKNILNKTVFSKKNINVRKYQVSKCLYRVCINLMFLYRSPLTNISKN